MECYGRRKSGNGINGIQGNNRTSGVENDRRNNGCDIVNSQNSFSDITIIVVSLNGKCILAIAEVGNGEYNKSIRTYKGFFSIYPNFGTISYLECYGRRKSGNGVNGIRGNNRTSDY